MSFCIKNISNELTEAKLKSLLRQYGSIKRIHFSSETQTPYEYYSALIKMENGTQEKLAIINLDRKQLHGYAIHIDPDHPICPCCSYPLLRHISSGKIYWRCQHCYQEMPMI